MPGLQELITDISEGKVTLSKKYKDFIATFDVDCQNGFSFNCPGELPVKGAPDIVEELNNQATYAKFRIGSKDAHCLSAVYNATPNEPQFTKILGYPDADLKWNTHCVMGTYGAELLKGLPPIKDYDFFVWKGIEPTMHPYGAIYHDLGNTLSTGVLEFININGIDTIIVGGLATDYCLRETVLSLAKNAENLSVIVNLGACRGISPDTVSLAIKDFHEAGVYIVDSADDLNEENFVKF
jgi:nicotinamidase/pyrazinamidase